MTRNKNERPLQAPEYKLINSQGDLSQLAKTLRKHEEIAVDLEADSMFHYQEKACLIQITANGSNYLIDPLADVDVSPLAPVFKSRRITKIFHGADYDIRCLFRDFGVELHGLFDTQVAARFLGEQQTGLAHLIKDHFGVTLEKKYQKKNWSQRPLPKEMLDYAVGDTIYLTRLAEKMKKRLEEKDRLFWVEEECRILTRARPAPPNDGPMFIRFRGAGRLDSRTLAVLERILMLRDEIARKWDRPHFKVVGNRPILEIAQKRPMTCNGLSQVHGFSPKQAGLFGKDIIKAIKDGMCVPDDQLPCYPKKKRQPSNAKAPRRTKALKEWRDKKGEELELESSVVLTNAQIHALSFKKPATRKEMGEIEEIRKWQIKVFGREIIDALKTVP